MINTIPRRMRQMLVSRIAQERSVSERDIIVIEVQRFPRNKWGHTGAITVCYNRAGHRATYGFDSLATVQCYAD